MLHFTLPMSTDGVRVAQSWRTLGMRATGSHDLLLDDVFVAEAAIVARRPHGVWHPVMHLAGMIAFPLVYSAYLGVAEAARDIAVGLAPQAKRGDAVVQLMAGEVENAIAAARLAVSHMVELGADTMPGPATTNALFTARTLAAEVALRCLDRAMELVVAAAFIVPPASNAGSGTSKLRAITQCGPRSR